MLSTLRVASKVLCNNLKGCRYVIFFELPHLYLEVRIEGDLLRPRQLIDRGFAFIAHEAVTARYAGEAGAVSEDGVQQVAMTLIGSLIK